jgi:hypothetical protein
MNSMAKKKTIKPKKIHHTVDTLSKTVRDISTSRKMEVESDVELSQALCGLADYAGALFLQLLDETIKTPNNEDKKKDMLLVLHLTYLKMCAEILETDTLDDTCDIPLSGYKGTKPISIKKDSVPIYF